MPFNAHRRFLKNFLGKTLWPFPTRLVSRYCFRRRQGLILTFHYVGEPVLEGVAEDLFLPKDEFIRILDFAAANLLPLPPVEFLGRLKDGTLPEKATLLTFDDCTRETMIHAMPELEKRRLTACLFVCPGLMEAGRTVPSLELMTLCALARAQSTEVELPGGGGCAAMDIYDSASRAAAYHRLWPALLMCPSRRQPAFLNHVRQAFGVSRDFYPISPLASWKTLTSLQGLGMVIGNHTTLHSTVTADGLPQFRADVEQAYRMLDLHLPESMRLFCYPHRRAADAGADVAKMLHELQTDFAFAAQGGTARPRRPGALALHRENAAYSVGATKLAPLLALFR